MALALLVDPTLDLLIDPAHAIVQLLRQGCRHHIVGCGDPFAHGAADRNQTIVTSL